MWRIFKAFNRGVRSVRLSQSYTPDYEDGKRAGQREPLPVAARRYYSRPQSSCNRTHEWPGTNAQGNSDQQLDSKSCILKQIYCNHKDRKNRPSSKTIVLNENLKPPWHWDILLDLHPQNTKQKGKSQENEKTENNKKWDRLCYRHQREKFLLTHSVLQALGWGSAVALTWSVYQYWGYYHVRDTWKAKQDIYNNDKNHSCRRLPYKDKDDLLENEDLENGFTCDSHEIPQGEKHFKNVSGLHSHSPSHFPISPNIEHNSDRDHIIQPNASFFLNPEANKSLFSCLWNVASAQPVSRNVVPKRKKRSNVISRSFDGDNEGQHLSHTNSEIEGSTRIEQEIESEWLSHLQDLFSLQEGTIETTEQSESNSDDRVTDSEQLICSHLPKSKAKGTRKSHDVGEQENAIQHDEEELLLHQETSEPDDEQNNLLLGTREKVEIEDCSDSGREQNNLLLGTREKVEIEDCSDSGRGTGKSTQDSDRSSQPHHNTKSSIEEFSDSLKELLENGSSDIKSLQDQLSGVIESDIGRSLAEEEPGSAIVYFQAGALLGDPSSSFNLALCYHLARGVKQDLKMARELYEAASLAGHGWATYNLAVMLSEGLGGPADPARAHRLLIKAAQKGVNEAQAALKLIEEQEKEFAYKEDPITHVQSEPDLLFTQSEPDLLATSAGTRTLSSSYSTSDLEFLDESSPLQFVEDLKGQEFGETQPQFFLEYPP